jgi:hypothetical protein
MERDRLDRELGGEEENISHCRISNSNVLTLMHGMYWLVALSC